MVFYVFKNNEFNSNFIKIFLNVILLKIKFIKMKLKMLIFGTKFQYLHYDSIINILHKLILLLKY